jgi:hypothetical protein
MLITLNLDIKDFYILILYSLSSFLSLYSLILYNLDCLLGLLLVKDLLNIFNLYKFVI